MPIVKFSSPAEEAAYEAELLALGATITKAASLDVPSEGPRTAQKASKKKAKPAPVVELAATMQSLWLDSWHPVLLNRIANQHWAVRRKRKAADAAHIALAWKLYGGRPATGARQLDLHIMLRKGQRAGDQDAYWKSLKDALVHCGALVDDNRQWCRDGMVTFSRGEGGFWGTLIQLREI